MRILQIYKSFYPETRGGVEQCIDTLMRGLTANNIDSSLITTIYNKNIINNKNINIKYFKANLTIASCPFSLEFFRNFRKIVKKFDLLHYHLPWPFADFTDQFYNSKIPRIVTYHSDIVKQKFLNIFYTPIQRLFLNRVDYIVATSPNYLQSSPVLQRYLNKTKIIPIGLEPTHYPKPSIKIINQWEQHVGSDFFLFIGVLRYYKGLRFLLEALRLDYIKNNKLLSLVIIGDGPERDYLRNFLNNNPQLAIHWVGAVSEVDKIALYTLCRGVISPAHLRSEALSLTLIEGLMMGKPLISTELNTGTSFVNQANQTGLIVPPADAEALREAMVRLKLDNKLCATFANNAKQRFITAFRAETMVQDYITLYQLIINK